MYKKVVECLSAYGKKVVQLERVKIKNCGISIKNVILTELNNEEPVYLEIEQDGDIFCWSLEAVCKFVIPKDKDFIMLFRLGSYIL